VSGFSIFGLLDRKAVAGSIYFATPVASNFPAWDESNLLLSL
jgi:hypothetical protein